MGRYVLQGTTNTTSVQHLVFVGGSVCPGGAKPKEGESGESVAGGYHQS